MLFFSVTKISVSSVGKFWMRLFPRSGSDGPPKVVWIAFHISCPIHSIFFTWPYSHTHFISQSGRFFWHFIFINVLVNFNEWSQWASQLEISKTNPAKSERLQSEKPTKYEFLSSGNPSKFFSESLSWVGCSDRLQDFTRTESRLFASHGRV